MLQKILKVGIIFVVVMMVLSLGGLVFAGYQYSYGPFKKLGNIKMGNLEGNAPAYDMNKLENENNELLTGKKVLFLGSSVTYGAASLGEAMGEYFEAKYGCVMTKEALSGTTLVDDSTTSYISRLKRNVGPSKEFDIVIVQLSTNDATKDKPLGEITTSNEYDTHTITGAIEYIINYCKENYQSEVLFYTGSRYDSDNYKKMVDRLFEIKNKWNIGVLDLYTSDEFNNITDSQRKLYMNDPIHPTKAGYREWWCPEMAKQLLEYLGK